MSTLSVAQLQAAIAGGVRPDLLFFWGHRPRRDGSLGPSCLSQWWPVEVEVGGQRFASAEHWMMWNKARMFDDHDAARRVLEAATPAEAKKLGAQVRGFDPDAWEAERFAIVVAGNRAKFGQHPDLAGFLRETAPRVLVEASPVDRIWGIGLAADDVRASDPACWQGLNLLGFALMQVRDEL
ncbi:MAG: hypothetical protein QOK35_2360 [Pseudonocardiales bacterium]|jgi:ribA/ribD-fused uncharacterized protein|nr:hypothetical protein [Pseudonocardiales bacterium]